MNKPYSKDFSFCIMKSRGEALRLQNSAIRAEHFLLGILAGKNKGAEILSQLCDDIAALKESLEEYLANSQDAVSAQSPDGEVALDTSATVALKDCIDEAFKLGDDYVRPEHLLLAILQDSGSHACKMLNEKGIYYDNVNKILSIQRQQTVSSMDLEDEGEGDEDFMSDKSAATEETRQNQEKKTDTPFLKKYGNDITKQAADGKLDPVVGREKEVERIAQILSRRKKNNPILIGEPGVGKTAIVEGLAERIVNMTVPQALLDKHIVALDMGSLIAGTKYRGQFEERVMGVVKELIKHPEIILFIDEIHTLVGAGAASGGMDAANILKPALSRGQLQCIGATTLDEFRKTIEKDGALERRFQKIMVNPSTTDETLRILNNIKSRYEDHHNVTYTEEAIEACVKLTDRYITDRKQPDKAIDAMDEAGSSVHIGDVQVPVAIVQLNIQLDEISARKKDAVKSQNFELAANLRDEETKTQYLLASEKTKWEEDQKLHRRSVDVENVEKTVSLMSGVPVQKMVKSEGVRLKGLREDLKKNIIEQDEAIDKLVKAITRNRIGLRDPNKPIGTFMFLGPTGVGKTYLAEKLAEYMFGSKDSIIRIDMSEYMEKYSTSRLVGAPPGYVGYEEGGQLTEKVRRHPYSIVLLDEIEKASHDVFNILLQVMDEGRLTDSAGTVVDFKNTIIIFTSNSGSRDVMEFGRGVGFGNPDENSQKKLADSIIMKSLNKQFAPEFINRLDDIIVFNPLNKKSIEQIASLELEKLRGRLLNMGYNFEISQKSMEFLVNKGFDNKYGARPLKRVIQTLIEDGIGSLIMEEKVGKDNLIHIKKKPGKEELVFE